MQINISYLTFCCLVSLSIFMSCAVLWRAPRANRNTNNTPHFADIYYRGCVTEVCEAEGISAGNAANWLVKSRRIRQTGFCDSGAIYFTFLNGKKCLSIVQITDKFKFFILRSLSRKDEEKKFVLTNNIFFVTSIQFVACTFRENLSSRTSGVQIPRDICTRFGRYLYSMKCSWL